MAKKEDLENIENQLSTEDKYQLAKECIEKEDYVMQSYTLNNWQKLTMH